MFVVFLKLLRTLSLSLRVGCALIYIADQSERCLRVVERMKYKSAVW